MTQDTQLQEAIIELVIARLQAMPEHIKLSIGGAGDFDKYALIDHVKKGDEIGKKIIKMHLHYLQSFKKRESYAK